MNGILDFIGNAIGHTGTLGQDDGKGILGWLSGTPQSLSGPAAPNPMTNRLGLFGSALQDMQGAIDGRPSNMTAMSIGGQKAANAEAGISQVIRDAYAKGDMKAVRQALLDHALRGGDISPITGAMSALQPKMQDIGGTGYTIDPLTGQATEAVRPRPKAPPGYQWGEDGKLHFIPGGPSDPSFAGALAGAKRKPSATTADGVVPPWKM